MTTAPISVSGHAQASLRRFVRRAAAARADELLAAAPTARATSSTSNARAIYAVNLALVAIAVFGFVRALQASFTLLPNVAGALLLGGAVAIASRNQLSVHVGQRNRWLTGFAEFPLGLALIFTNGWGVLAGLLVGSAIGYRVQRHTPVKLIFNVANYTAAGTVALAVQQVVPGRYASASIAVLAWCVVNHWFTQLVVHLAGGAALRRGVAMRWEALAIDFLAGFTGTVTGVLLHSGSAGALVAPLPLVGVWTFFRMRQQTSDVLRMRRALLTPTDDGASVPAQGREQAREEARDFNGIATAVIRGLNNVFAEVHGDLILHVGGEVRRYAFGPEGTRSVPADRSDLMEPWVMHALGRPAHLIADAPMAAMSLSASQTTGVALRVGCPSGVSKFTRVDLPAIAAAVTQAASWTASLDVDTLIDALRCDLGTAIAEGGSGLSRHLLTLQDVRGRLIEAAQALPSEAQSAALAQVIEDLGRDIARAENAVSAALASLLNGDAQGHELQDEDWTTTGTVTSSTGIIAPLR